MASWFGKAPDPKGRVRARLGCLSCRPYVTLALHTPIDAQNNCASRRRISDERIGNSHAIVSKWSGRRNNWCGCFLAISHPSLVVSASDLMPTYDSCPALQEADIKKMLQQGDKKNATILAKQLVQVRKCTTRSTMASSQMNAIGTRATVRVTLTPLCPLLPL